MTDGDGEAAEIEQLRAEAVHLRAENAALHQRCAELLGAEAAYRCLLREMRETRGTRRLSSEQVKLLGKPTAGSA